MLSSNHCELRTFGASSRGSKSRILTKKRLTSEALCVNVRKTGHFLAIVVFCFNIVLVAVLEPIFWWTCSCFHLAFSIDTVCDRFSTIKVFFVYRSDSFLLLLYFHWLCIITFVTTLDEMDIETVVGDINRSTQYKGNMEKVQCSF